MSNQPIVFNIRYTPYKPSATYTDKQRAAHREEREFFSMTSGRNIYSYLTQGAKLGEAATFLDYMQKSTGVFNMQGALSKEEVADMKARLRTNEGNLWHGYISLNEEKSEMIDTPEKSIKFIKRIFGSFFKEAGFTESNMDLMCALHLDRPHHLHIHFLFWEKEPKIVGKDGAKHYRSKGRISKAAIDNLFVRSGIYVSGDKDTIGSDRQTAIKTLKSITEIKRAMYLKADIKREITAIAKEIPNDKRLGYNHKEMAPYRERVDNIVSMLLAYDGKARRADMSFYKSLTKRQILIENICGNVFAFSDGDEDIAETASKDRYHFKIDPKNIRMVDDIRKDYIRRQGNLVINLARAIKPEIFERDPKKKYKASDNRLKRRLNISDKKVTRLFEKFIKSFCFENGLLERDYSHRLQDIEEEIEREQKERKKEESNYNE